MGIFLAVTYVVGVIVCTAAPVLCGIHKLIANSSKKIGTENLRWFNEYPRKNGKI